MNLMSNILLFIIDLFKSTKISYYYNFYNKTLNWTREEIVDYQNKKIHEIVKHAYENTIYYRKLLDDLNLNPNLFTSKEKLGLLPVLERNTLVKKYDDLIDTKNSYSKLFKSSSSGTTGEPVKYVHDIEGESAGKASGLCLYNLTGYKPNTNGIHIWGNAESIKKWNTISSKLKRFLLNKIYFPSINLNEEKGYHILLELISKRKPKYIDGYAGAIASFAKWLKKENIKLKNIEGVITTAEKITDTDKNNIEECIAPVNDMYGCGEINGVAIKLHYTPNYLIMDPHVVVETIIHDGIKKIVITDLNNKVMPFIRYVVGDSADSISEPDKLSKYQFSVFNQIVGRESEYIKLKNNQIIHPVNIFGGTVLRKFPQIERHKVIWTGEKLFFEIQIQNQQNKLLESIKSTIKESMHNYPVDIDIIFTKTIKQDSKSGKYHYYEYNKNYK